MIVHCSDCSYWHSDTVTCIVRVYGCPVCGRDHSVALYVRDDHEELPPQDFLNAVRLPCGPVVDLILERKVVESVGRL